MNVLPQYLRHVGRFLTGWTQKGGRKEGRKESTMRSLARRAGSESDSLELHVPSVEENTRFPSVIHGEFSLSVVVLNPP